MQSAVLIDQLAGVTTTINSAGGNIYLKGLSVGDSGSDVFGVALKDASGAGLTNLITSVSTGNLLIDAQYISASTGLPVNTGTFAATSSGSAAAIQFYARSPGNLLVLLNGTPTSVVLASFA